MRFPILVLIGLPLLGSAQQPSLRLPWADGARYVCTQAAGGGTSHNGDYTRYDVDFGLPAGTMVLAAGAGTVYNYANNGSWGNTVKVDHGNGYYSFYAHLQDGSFQQSHGTTVGQGASVGRCGNTGNSFGAHLHFGVRNGAANVANVHLSIVGDQVFGRNWTDNGSFQFFATTGFIAGKSYEAGSPTVTTTFTTYPPQNKWYNSLSDSTRLNYTVGGGNPNEVGEICWQTGNPNAFGNYSNIGGGYIQLDYAGLGWHQYEVRARRNNTSPWVYSGRWHGGFDNVPPSVSRTGGVSPGVWVRGNPTVTYTGTDAHAGFRESSFGFGTLNLGTASTANPRLINLPTASGEYNLLVRAEDHTGTLADDQAGNTTDASLGTFRVDNTSPTVGITNVNPTSGGSPTGVQIAASAADGHSGVARIEVTVNGTLIGTINGASGTVNWNTAGYPASNSIQAKAFDNVGNEAAAGQIYLLDTSAPPVPTVTDEGPSTTSWQRLSFGLAMSDPDSAIVEYEYKLGLTPGGSEVRPAVSISGTSPYQVVGNLNLPHGQLVFMSVRARNANGLWSAWGTSDGIEYNSFIQPEQLAASVLASGSESTDGTNFLTGSAGEPIAKDNIAGFWSLADLAQLMGTITLQNFVASQALRPITLELTQGGITQETLMVVTDAAGSFTASTALEGTFEVMARASTWLRKNLGTVVTSEGIVVTVNGSLLNGDCNGDNIVDIADYAILASAFDSQPGDGNWDVRADLDGSGLVDIADYAALAANFDQLGE